MGEVSTGDQSKGQRLKCYDSEDVYGDGTYINYNSLYFTIFYILLAFELSNPLITI